MLKERRKQPLPLGALALVLHKSKCTYTQARLHVRAPTHTTRPPTQCWPLQPRAPLLLTTPVPWWSFKNEVLPKRGWWFPCWQPSPLPACTALLLKCTGLTRANSAKQTALLVTTARWKPFLPPGSRVKTGEGPISGLASAARTWGPCLPPLLANCLSPPPSCPWLESGSWTGIRYPSLWTTPHTQHTSPPVSGSISHAPGLESTVPPAKQPTPFQSDNAEPGQGATSLLGLLTFRKGTPFKSPPF